MGSSFVGGKSNIGTFTLVSLAHLLRLFTKDTLELSLGTIGVTEATAEYVISEVGASWQWD